MRQLFSIFTIISVFISLFSGCGQKEIPPSPPYAQWNSFVAETEKDGYQLISVNDSQNWINRYVFDSYKLVFLKKTIYKITINRVPRTYIITVDHNSKPRVFKPFESFKPPPTREQQWKDFVANRKRKVIHL